MSHTNVMQIYTMFSRNSDDGDGGKHLIATRGTPTQWFFRRRRRKKKRGGCGEQWWEPENVSNYKVQQPSQRPSMAGIAVPLYWVSRSRVRVVLPGESTAIRAETSIGGLSAGLVQIGCGRAEDAHVWERGKTILWTKKNSTKTNNYSFKI